MDIPMLNIRQKEITFRIKSKGFKLKEFQFKAISNLFYELRFIGSAYYFITNKDGFLMSPGLNGGIKKTANVGGWEANLGYLEKWLAIVKLEKEIGNPWEEDEDEFHFYQDINEEYQDAETSFAETEIRSISICLSVMKDHLLSNSELTMQQLNSIVNDIKRLEENSNKISAKDWYLLFMGQLLSWVAAGFLTPDQPKLLFDKLSEFVTNGVTAVFNILE